MYTLNTLSTSVHTPSLPTALADFLRSRDIRPGSQSTYRRQLRQFFDWLLRENISRPVWEDILRFKAALEARGLSPLTISGYLVAVRQFFQWTDSKGLHPNIAKSVKVARRPRGFRREPLTTDQVKNLLAVIGRSTLLGKRDYALLNLLIRTGLRAIELVRANRGDIRQESGEAVLWIQGKGRDAKEDFVLLTPPTLGPLREYLAAAPGPDHPDLPLFASHSDRNPGGRLTCRTVSRIAKAHLRRIGLESRRLTAHSLRHTAITFSLLGGATLQEAQALGRHGDINTTLIYAHNIHRVHHAPERKIDALLAAGGASPAAV
jgi:integrase/recombinase XerC/integrase/recombinase XerD